MCCGQRNRKKRKRVREREREREREESSRRLRACEHMRRCALERPSEEMLALRFAAQQSEKAEEREKEREREKHLLLPEF